ncbi:hypothetical protein [Bifidobacterium favimelis]|uniref:Colicin transporter n=1 Tax=Bifidobacterium favimelis TaxID=3122979 RepID=A0ABU8ZLF2_9BIFI
MRTDRVPDAAEDAAGGADTGGRPAVAPAPSGPVSGGGGRIAAVIVAFAVLALLLAGLGGFAWWRYREGRLHDQALSSCKRESRLAASELDKLEQTMTGRRQLADIGRNEVEKSSTIDDFRVALKQAEDAVHEVPSCLGDDSRKTLDEAASASLRAAKAYEDRNQALESTARTLIASRDAKILDDARKALSSQRERASSLLSDSAGKVADETTRDALREAIDRAGRMDSGSLADCKAEGDSLSKAMDAVNASMRARAEADAAGGRPSDGSKDGHANVRAPSLPPRRQNVNPPRKQAPAQNDGGDESWREKLKGNVSNGGKPVCKKGEACGIG